MNKYIKEFKQVGESIVNVDLICKDWNDRFLISTWINDNEETYTFVINGKRKNTRLCKTVISRDQALTIIDKLSLIHVKSSLFTSGGVYYKQSFIDSEIERINGILKEKREEVAIIEKVLHSYQISIQ